ncbi:MAG: serine/threonine-protein kinase [Polyangia bacterium]
MQVESVFAPGHVLNDTYRVVRLLGQGGMGCLYEVDHLRLPRKFALKVLSAPSTGSSEYMLRFRREAEILASLDHPNVVQVMDWNVTQQHKPYLVMELLSGEDLSQLLTRTGALLPQVALSIFAQAVAALEVAHSHGITHRDLKPANIFLCKNGVVPHFTKVLDFGIAKSMQHVSGLVSSHLVLMGTPAYMSPEQARGDQAGVDARSDQFSLGLVLYEMLLGTPAFYRRHEAPMITICRVMQEDPAPLPDASLNRAIMRALRKKPDERYPSLSEMLAAVLAAAEVSPEQIEIPERTEPVCVGTIQPRRSSVKAGSEAKKQAPINLAATQPPQNSIGSGSKPERSRGSYPLGVPIPSVAAVPAAASRLDTRPPATPAAKPPSAGTPPSAKNPSAGTPPRAQQELASAEMVHPVVSPEPAKLVMPRLVGTATAGLLFAGCMLLLSTLIVSERPAHRLEKKDDGMHPMGDAAVSFADMCGDDRPSSLPDLQSPSDLHPAPPSKRLVLRISGISAPGPAAGLILGCVRSTRFDLVRLQKTTIDLQYGTDHLLHDVSLHPQSRELSERLELCLGKALANAATKLSPYQELKVHSVEELIP